jgi:hypothetical protein
MPAIAPNLDGDQRATSCNSEERHTEGDMVERTPRRVGGEKMADEHGTGAEERTTEALSASGRVRGPRSSELSRDLCDRGHRPGGVPVAQHRTCFVHELV